MNANYGLMPELVPRESADAKRKSQMGERALAAIDEWIAAQLRSNRRDSETAIAVG